MLYNALPYSLPIKHCIVYFFKKAGVIIDKISANLSVSMSLQWGWEKLCLLWCYLRRWPIPSPCERTCVCLHLRCQHFSSASWPTTQRNQLWCFKDNCVGLTRTYTDPSVTLYSLLCMFESACNIYSYDPCDLAVPQGIGLHQAQGSYQAALCILCLRFMGTLWCGSDRVSLVSVFHMCGVTETPKEASVFEIKTAYGTC